MENGQNHETAPDQERYLSKKWNLARKSERPSDTLLRSGRTRLTHSHLITKNEPAECDVCKVPVSVQHILTECVKYTINRNQHKIGTDLKQMLTDPDIFNNVLTFLEDIGIRQLN